MALPLGHFWTYFEGSPISLSLASFEHPRVAEDHRHRVLIDSNLAASVWLTCGLTKPSRHDGEQVEILLQKLGWDVVRCWGRCPTQGP